MALRERKNYCGLAINSRGAFCGCCDVHDACGALGQKRSNTGSGRLITEHHRTDRSMVYRRGKKREGGRRHANAYHAAKRINYDTWNSIGSCEALPITGTLGSKGKTPRIYRNSDGLDFLTMRWHEPSTVVSLSRQHSQGELANAKEVVGHQLFTEDGKHIGSVAGVAVDPKTWKMTSVVMTSDRTGTTDAAIPFNQLALDAKSAGIVTRGSNEEDLGKRWPIESYTAFLNNTSLAAFGFCVMCAYPSMVPIDIISDPAGGTIFGGEEPRGNTELHGIITITQEPTIRIEYPKRKSCKFAEGTFTPPQATGGYATFYCKLAP